MNSPFGSRLPGLVVGFAFAYFSSKFFWNVDVENFRQHGNLVHQGQGFDARDDGDSDPGSTAAADKIVIFLVIEKHLGDDVICTCIHFLFQVKEVGIRDWKLRHVFLDSQPHRCKSQAQPCFSVRDPGICRYEG